jgi:hypothetical protein
VGRHETPNPHRTQALTQWAGYRSGMRFSPQSHMEMAKRLDERAKKSDDPKKAKKIAAMANTFRLLARRAAKQGAKSG